MTEMEQSLYWNEYKLQIELWKFYLERLINTNVVYYTIFGTFYGIFWKSEKKHKVKRVLWVPIIMGLCQVILMCFWMKPLADFNGNIECLGKLLNLHSLFNPVVLTLSAYFSTAGWAIVPIFTFRLWVLAGKEDQNNSSLEG